MCVTDWHPDDLGSSVSHVTLGASGGENVDLASFAGSGGTSIFLKASHSSKSQQLWPLCTGKCRFSCCHCFFIFIYFFGGWEKLEDTPLRSAATVCMDAFFKELKLKSQLINLYKIPLLLSTWTRDAGIQKLSTCTASKCEQSRMEYE